MRIAVLRLNFAAFLPKLGSGHRQAGPQSEPKSVGFQPVLPCPDLHFDGHVQRDRLLHFFLH